jgi:hypothetical protein
LSDEKMIDAQVTDAVNGKSGYKFSANVSNTSNAGPASFAIGARPTIADGVFQSGIRRFCIATDGVFYTYTDSAGGDPTRSGPPAGCEPITDDNGGALLQ